MVKSEGGVIVGVLGQWASGKSTAARTLLAYFGGEPHAVFIDDRELVYRLAVHHVLKAGDSKLALSIEDDGQQRLEGERVVVWLDPGEDPSSVDWSRYHRFDVPGDLLPAWLNEARVELGRQICDRRADGKPIVIEAGFGKNPPDHTISDLFVRLEEAGVEPGQVRWIIVETSYDKRSMRNEKRQDSVPLEVFARYAADGGDLDPDHQTRLMEQGTTIKRVPNNHDDVERFRAEIVAALEGLFPGVLPMTSPSTSGSPD